MIGISGAIMITKVLTIALLVGMPVAFIAMNPYGFFQIIATGGQFMITTVIDIFKGGFAGLWWFCQAAISSVVNFGVGIINAVINQVNTWLHVNIPTWTYLQAPDISPTLKSVVEEITEGWQQTTIAMNNYWSKVQEEAPVSYVKGGIAGGTSSGLILLANRARQGTQTMIDVTDSYALQKKYAKLGYKLIVKNGRTYAVKKAKTTSM